MSEKCKAGTRATKKVEVVTDVDVGDRLWRTLSKCDKDSPLTLDRALTCGRREIVEKMLERMIADRVIATYTLNKAGVRQDFFWLIGGIGSGGAQKQLHPWRRTYETLFGAQENKKSIRKLK